MRRSSSATLCSLRRAAHAALRAAVGQAEQRALPGHPHRERRALAERDVGAVAKAALRRAHRQRVLHAVAGQAEHLAGVQPDREVHDERAPRLAQPGDELRVELEQRARAVELVGRDAVELGAPLVARGDVVAVVVVRCAGRAGQVVDSHVADRIAARRGGHALQRSGQSALGRTRSPAGWRSRRQPLASTTVPGVRLTAIMGIGAAGWWLRQAPIVSLVTASGGYQSWRSVNWRRGSDVTRRGCFSPSPPGSPPSSPRRCAVIPASRGPAVAIEHQRAEDRRDVRGRPTRDDRLQLHVAKPQYPVIQCVSDGGSGPWCRAPSWTPRRPGSSSSTAPFVNGEPPSAATSSRTYYGSLAARSRRPSRSRRRPTARATARSPRCFGRSGSPTRAATRSPGSRAARAPSPTGRGSHLLHRPRPPQLHRDRARQGGQRHHGYAHLHGHPVGRRPAIGVRGSTIRSTSP